MHKHVVIDIETVDNKPGAHIIEIGAVALGGEGPESRFQVLINSTHANEYGLTSSAETLNWWKQQDFYLPNVADEEGIDIRDAYQRFLGWFGAVADEKTRVWGNSPSFDCELLREALQRAGVGPTPWSFRNERDMRTLRDLLPIDISSIPKMLPAHRGLNDALYEAEVLRQTLLYHGKL